MVLFEVTGQYSIDTVFTIKMINTTDIEVRIIQKLNKWKLKVKSKHSTCSFAALLHRSMKNDQQQGASWVAPPTPPYVQPEKACMMFCLSQADIIMPQPTSSISEYSTSLTRLHLTSIQL